MNQKALVIGFGSIGARHAEVLTHLGVEVAVLSQHAKKDTCQYELYTDLETALEITRPQYVVIANNTNDHYSSFLALQKANFAGTVLIEKPIFDQMKPVLDVQIKLFVGYVLRFHPVLQKAKELLSGETLWGMQVYCGQYLPDWRPSQDYEKSYSCFRQKGGGVLRDLSHELDYIQYLSGQWEKVCALGGRYGDLEIESEDQYHLLLTTRNCKCISCQLNYLDRNVKRDCVIQYSQGTLQLDLVNNVIVANGKRQNFLFERNDLFRAMHEAVLTGDETYLCSYQQAVQTVGLIEASEQSNEKERWTINHNQ
jgi:predicted dehydrogenase